VTTGPLHLDEPIYLDHQATTPLDQRVLDAMLPYLSRHFANAASPHAAGRAAAAAVDDARGQLAELLGARPHELVFTSGATEANNLAIKGLAVDPKGRRHLVACATEHPSVLEPLRRLAAEGFELTKVGVDRRGTIDLAELEEAVGPQTLLVCVMAANNEVGTVAPVRRVVEIAHAQGAAVHCDATQAVGKLDVDVDDLGADLVAMSAHKLYGPKGVGALYIRRTLVPRIRPLLDGGGHERGLRSGTTNVAGCVGLGVAAVIAGAEMGHEAARLRALADQLRHGIERRTHGIALVGHPTERIPGNLSLAFAGTDAEDVMLSMPDVAVSTGSACSTAARTPSHVLLALGLDYVAAQSVLRFGVGRFTTPAEVDTAAVRVTEAVACRRADSSPIDVGAGR